MVPNCNKFFRNENKLIPNIRSFCYDFSDRVVIMSLTILTINYLGSFLYTILYIYFHLSMWERVSHVYTIYLDEIVGALIFYLIIEPSKKLMYGFFCKLPN